MSEQPEFADAVAQAREERRVEHDTQATDDIVCPHCGYSDPDSFEHHRDHQGMPLGIKTECGKCEQPFEFDVEYTPTYWSRIPITRIAVREESTSATN